MCATRWCLKTPAPPSIPSRTPPLTNHGPPISNNRGRRLVAACRSGLISLREIAPLGSTLTTETAVIWPAEERCNGNPDRPTKRSGGQEGLEATFFPTALRLSQFS